MGILKKGGDVLKMKSLFAGLGILLLAVILAIAGCQKAPETPPDTFSSTYYLGDEGRSLSISGCSDGMPGEQSEYLLKIKNGAERWQDEYCVLLVDSDSVLREVSHERFDIPGGGGAAGAPPIITGKRDGCRSDVYRVAGSVHY
jgi:hypothetical protein